MKPATHTATCQLCGKRHKLPGADASLAKHGYTVNHGFFSNTCTGAGYQPYELAHDALDAAIPRQESFINLLKASYEAAKIDPNLYTEMEIEPAKFGKEARYRELEVAVVMRKARYDYRETPHALAVYEGKELVKQIRLPLSVVGEPSVALGERLLRNARLGAILTRIDNANHTLKYLKDRREAWFLNTAGVLPVNDNEGKDWVLRSKIDSSFVIQTWTAGYGTCAGFRTDPDAAKALRYTERGAKMMISRMRAHKTLEAVEVK